LLEELGYSMDDLTWDGQAIYDPMFEEILAAAKEAAPNFYPLIIQPDDFMRHINTSDNDPTNTNLIHLGFDPSDPTQPEQVKAAFNMEVPGYVKAVEKMQDFFAKGYIDPAIAIGATSDTTVTEAWNSGNYLISSRLINPGFDAAQSDARGIEVKSAIISNAVTPSIAQGSGYAVSIYSKNPKESLQFLNALMTDQILSTVIAYGVEDIHWVDNGDGTITRTDRGLAEYNIWTPGIGSVYTRTPQAAEGPYYADTYKEFNEAGIPVSFAGFAFDDTRVRDQIAALSSVGAEYLANVFSGAADDATVAEFIKVAKDNGIDQVLIEMNRQLNAFYEAK
jgi:putative aldouronate transport system substrate-binding protein